MMHANIICSMPSCQTTAGCVCATARVEATFDLRAAYKHSFGLLDTWMLSGQWEAAGGALAILCSPPTIDLAIGALRFTSSAKGRIRNWHEYVRFCRPLLTMAGRDATDELRGLE